MIAEIVSEYASGSEINLMRVFFIAMLVAGVLGLKRLKA